MVFVKVRETYDLHTTQNKMTVIAIHTPKPDIIKRTYPGLLMQCKTYRPYSCDVRLACASVMPLDPLGVGTAEGDVAPEDVFNPILYKAMSNKGMSMLEGRIHDMVQTGPSVVPGSGDLAGSSASVEVDDFTGLSDEFGVYYGLLSQTNEWKHANPQSGMSMSGLRPLVYDMMYNIGDNRQVNQIGASAELPVRNPVGVDPVIGTFYGAGVLGNAHPMPFIPCTNVTASGSAPGFSDDNLPSMAAQSVNWLRVICGCIIVPPSRRHELFFRMVVEWTLEFSSIRPISEVTGINGLAGLGDFTHFQNYDYSSAKKLLTGSEDSILQGDSCMVSSNVNVEKVM